MKFSYKQAKLDWKRSYYFHLYGGLGTSWTWLFANEYYCLIKETQK
jgi:hypothetical protein